MRIAITGGTGFIGTHLALHLLNGGHEVVLITRGVKLGDRRLMDRPGAIFAPVSLDDPATLAAAFSGCTAVAHCAGINRQLGRQTYQRVHVEGTRNVVAAARVAGVQRIALMSFLRARPEVRSGYHRSKFAAEQIVRQSGLTYTILKSGVIYGRGDHMLDHLSHAFHTFPVFALVGMREQLVRPTAVADVVRILHAAIVEGRLANQTVAVTGPEEMTLAQAVRRVADVVGKSPLYWRLPLWFHFAFAWICERGMKVPLASTAQVCMLSEGLVEPLPQALCTDLPADLRPRLSFTDQQIRLGLPAPQGFSLRDCRCLGQWRHAH